MGVSVIYNKHVNIDRVGRNSTETPGAQRKMYLHVLLTQFSPSGQSEFSYLFILSSQKVP